MRYYPPELVKLQKAGIWKLVPEQEDRLMIVQPGTHLFLWPSNRDSKYTWPSADPRDYFRSFPSPTETICTEGRRTHKLERFNETTLRGCRR